jgi:hypothetical protein
MIDTDDKEMFAEELAEYIVNSYNRDSLERIVWDVTYEELSKNCPSHCCPVKGREIKRAIAIAPPQKKDGFGGLEFHLTISTR